MNRKFTKYPSNYVNASTGSSSWFRTDDYQICKNLGNGEYQFIEFTGTDGQMISSYGTVNVNDYKDANGNWDEEALDIISTYYSDFDELRASVPNSSGEDQIVAECIFEQTSSFDSDSVTLSEDEAYAYLDDIISGKIEASTSIKASIGTDDIKYYEVEFDTVPRNQDDIDGDVVGEYSICIRGTRRPSLKEAAEFCASDMEQMRKELGDDVFVVNVSEIDKEEASSFFDMENEANYPVFSSTSIKADTEDNSRMEYALEVYTRDDSDRGEHFTTQIDVFDTPEDAYAVAEKFPLDSSNVFYVIRYIEYERNSDGDWEEVDAGRYDEITI